MTFGWIVPKRSAQRQACIVLSAASLFLGVTFLLSARLSSQMLDSDVTPPLNEVRSIRWDSVLAGLPVDSEAVGNMNQAFSTVLNMSLWRIVAIGGAAATISDVSRPIETGRGREELVYILPKGAIIIGMTWNASHTLSACVPDSYTIKLYYPIRGWLHSGECLSRGVHTNVVKLEEDQTKLIRRATDVIVPLNPLCEPSKIRPGVDLMGGDVAPLPQHVSSPVECCSLCINLASCGGWTVTNNRDCWLKRIGQYKEKILPGKVANAVIASGIVPPHNGSALPLFRGSADSSVPRFPACCRIGAARGEGSQSSFDEDSTVVRVASSRLDWTTQFPIGTGAMGALVGGTSNAEIIPISAAGYFVTQEGSVDVAGIYPLDKGRVSPGSSMSHMSVVRDAFLRNDRQGAHAALGRATTTGQVIKGRHPVTPPVNKNDKRQAPVKVDVAPQGSFQYLCDVNILFDIPLEMQDEGNSAEFDSGKPGVEAGKKPPSGPNLMDQRGRSGVLARLYAFVYRNVFVSSMGAFVRHWRSTLMKMDSALKNSPPCETCAQEQASDSNTFATKGYRDISDSFLDTITGVVNSFYLRGYSLPLENRDFDVLRDAVSRAPLGSDIAPRPLYYHLQERTWFASSLDDVIVGQLKGVYFRKSNVGSDAMKYLNGTPGELVDGASDITVSLTRDIIKLPVSNDLIYSSACFEWPETAFSVFFSGSVSTPTLAARSDVIRAASDESRRPSKYSSRVYGVEVSLSTRRQAIVTAPNAVVCAAVVCLRRAAVDDSNFQDKHYNTSRGGTTRSDLPTWSNSVFCPAVDEVQIYISSGVGKSSYDTDNVYNHVNDLEELRQACWRTVNKAARRGYSDVKNRHVTQFRKSRKERFAEIDFAKNSVPYSHQENVIDDAYQINHDFATCPDAPASIRLASFGHGCIEQDVRRPLGVASDDVSYHSTIDSNLFSQMYNFGTYLMISSGSKSVSNLQGLWADGPTAAWNGDYHLNINLQMNYWAMHSSGMAAELSPPFFDLIDKLAVAGESAASNIYDCKGWVAHGFTDASLRGHLHGDGQWALCVTCGAWVALHLWEAVLHEPVSTLWALRIRDMPLDLSKTAPLLLLEYIRNESSVLYKMVENFRGIVQFFTEYMHIDADGTVHTGPTTSPENSYFVNDDEVEFLTMSPAIDMSVLRQVSSALLMALSWKKADILSCINWLENFDIATLDEDLQKKRSEGMSLLNAKLRAWRGDAKLALRFIRLVQRMPGSAAPMIERATDNSFQSYDAEIISEYPGLAAGGRPNIAAVSISARHLNRTNNIRQSAAEAGVAQALDLSHRHWSSLHWLYPGTFLPFSMAKIKVGDNNFKEKSRLFKATHNTILMKARAGGGHTGWSAVWGAALFARLADGEGAFRLLSRTLQLYTAPNLLGLHPALASREIKKCETCFFDPNINFNKAKEDFFTSGSNESMMDPFLHFKKPAVKKNLGVAAALLDNSTRSTLKSRRLLSVDKKIPVALMLPHYPDARWADSTDRITRVQVMRRTPQGKHPIGADSTVISNRWADNEFFGKGLSGVTNFPGGNLRGTIKNKKLGKEVDYSGPLRANRGMATVDNAMFQFDTNAGFVAAVNEMLVQSHIPSHVSLLPALPAELSDFGHLRRIQCRGGVSVSMQWSLGMLQRVTFHFQHPHPWLAGFEEDPNYPGFPVVPLHFLEKSANIAEADGRQYTPESELFSEMTKKYDTAITFDSPNRLRLVSSSSEGEVKCAEELSFSGNVHTLVGPRNQGMLKIFHFPCVVSLVDTPL